MTVEERRIYLICNYIDECIDGTCSIYKCGNIPARVISGARETYAYYSDDETVICVVDTTVFGGGQRGMVFTDKNVYYRGMFENPVNWNYFDITLQFSDELPNDVYFNRKNLKKLMAYLFDMECISIGGIAFADTGIWITEQAKKLISLSMEALGESDKTNQEELAGIFSEHVKDTFEFLMAPDSWLNALEEAMELKDSDEIKSMVVSFDRFLEAIDYLTWYIWLGNIDALINTVLSDIDLDRIEAELSDSFERLIDKMEDAVNDYYSDVSLIDIVCNLKEYVEAFSAEVKYDMVTMQYLFNG